MDGKRVHAARELDRKRLIDHAVTFDAGLSLERIRHDIDPIVGLPARPVSGVAFMLLRFVNYFEALRREGGAQLFCDEIGGSPIVRLCTAWVPVEGHQKNINSSTIQAKNTMY